MTATPKILVAGGINVDDLLWLDRPPADDDSVKVVRRLRAFGGHAANCAVALARLGFEVAIAGAVGVDENGVSSLAHLESELVDTRHVHRCADRPTGTVIIPQAPDLRFMLMERGANDASDPLALIGLPIERYDAIVAFDPSDALLAEITKRSHGGQRRVWAPGGLRAANDCLSSAHAFDALVLNRAEAHSWFGWESGSRGGAPPGLPPHLELVVTLGPEGSVGWAGGQRVMAPGIPVDTVDATGAGDAFVAGFVAAPWMLPESLGPALHASLAIGNLLGACATEGSGAQGGLRDFRAVATRASQAGIRLSGGWA